MSSFSGRVTVVTGATSGIGKAIALRLSQAGAKVFALGRDTGRLAELSRSTPALFAHACDVTREDSVAAAFAACRERCGPVAMLVNNAGVGLPTPDLGESRVELLDRMFETHVRGSFLCAREALRDMRAAGRGHILNVISAAGKKANPTAPLYCASKFGQRGFSAGLAEQLLPLGIKVTDLNPAATDTGYWGDRPAPREKFLKAGDVAEAALFILGQPEHVLIRELDMESMLMSRRTS
ncbi:MAG: SDR family oxidoreductase [Planctomycetota bacterium]|nr:SDR family oxidoreductase [Planctomycetota bacterium]